MGNRIMLEQFKPFSGMKNMYPHHNYPYENCNYNLLLTLAQYFHKSELPILNNAVNIYRFDESKLEATGYFMLEVINFQKQDELMESLGIATNKKAPKIHCLQGEIIDSLSKGCPITMYIDLFYQKGRDFYYNKKHGYHPVLVYGYDLARHDIFIIDDISGYKEYCLPFSEFQRYCEGIFFRFPYYYREHSLHASAAGKPSEREHSLQDDLRDFAENMIRYQPEIMEGLQSVHSLADHYEHVVKNADIIETLSSTIYRKCSEKYRLYVLNSFKLFHENDSKNMDSLMEDIIDQWILVRTITSKVTYTHNFDEEKVSKCKHIIKNIYGKELEYHRLFFSMLHDSYTAVDISGLK